MTDVRSVSLFGFVWPAFAGNYPGNLENILEIIKMKSFRTFVHSVSLGQVRIHGENWGNDHPKTINIITKKKLSSEAMAIKIAK